MNTYLFIKDHCVIDILKREGPIRYRDYDLPFDTVVIDYTNSYKTGDEFDFHDYINKCDLKYGRFKNIIDIERYKK